MRSLFGLWRNINNNNNNYYNLRKKLYGYLLGLIIMYAEMIRFNVDICYILGIDKDMGFWI